MSDDEGTWYELRPHGDSAGDAERYRERAAADQAATAMLIRRPDIAFVEIEEYAVRDGATALVGTVGRIASAQPPAPSEAEVDGLHLLPRGDPEC